MRQELTKAFEGATKAPKHHYIPIFYLKQWVSAADGRLCEISRPYKAVKPRRTAPDGTGYVRGLYTIPGVAPEKANILESGYMRNADDWAARALRILVDPNSNNGTIHENLKAGWARFLYCMILRSPEYLERASGYVARNIADAVEGVRDIYEAQRDPGMPATFDEFKAEYLADPFKTSPHRILHELIDSERVINLITSFRWWTITFNNPKHLLLTSDRPIIMTDGLGRPEAHIAMPISPRQLFFATPHLKVYRAVASTNQDQLIRSCNKRICEQAVKYVYGFSDAQVGFVGQHLGKCLPATPLETRSLRRNSETNQQMAQGREVTTVPDTA